MDDDGFPMIIRETTGDRVIFGFAGGGILLIWFLLIIYLVVQRIRNTREKATTIKSKADRPWYLTGLTIAGTSFMLGTMFTTGTVRLRQPISYLPAAMIYFFQYFFGALFWLWLTLDRMLQRFAQVRFAGVEKNRKGLILRFVCFFIAFIPFLALSIVAVALDKVEVNAFGVTDQDDTFEILMVVYLGLFLLSVCFLAFKIRKIIGNFHELYRYSGFVFTTMLFFIYDAMTTLWHDLQTEIVAQNVLMMLVWTIVVGNMVWVFALALKPRKVSKDIENQIKDQDIVKKTVGDQEAINNFIDMDSGGAREESSDSLNSTQFAKNIIWFRKPKRRLREQMPPDFIGFIGNLPKPVSEQLDWETGYFAQTSGIQRTFEYRSPAGLIAKLKS